jgi:hypothetical protein
MPASQNTGRWSQPRPRQSLSMLNHPAIHEVWERTEQGMTRPYRCGADDGHSYYVKSRGAGWRSLVCEWVAGRLAVQLNLPIAPFAQVQVPAGFETIFKLRGDHDLAAGLAFGSRIAEQTREFEPSLLARCKPAFRRDLVVFDWWVRNADRTLGALSGNPNLLWNTATEAPVVIDHNMAFDQGFDAALFMETHVFRVDLAEVAGDMLLRADYAQRFTSLLAEFATIWAELPQNWVVDEDGQARVDPDEFLAVLQRVNHPGGCG